MLKVEELVELLAEEFTKEQLEAHCKAIEAVAQSDDELKVPP